MYKPVPCFRCPIITDCPLRNLSEIERRQLKESQSAWQVHKGGMIYVEGIAADGTYILCNGSVELVSTTNTGSRIVAVIKPGEWFGLDALLPNLYRSFTAIARTRSTICYFERTNLAELLHSHGEFIWRIVTGLILATDDAQRSVTLFSGQRVRQRLLGAITWCNSRSIDLKQVELSRLLGIPAETISREIRHLRQLRTNGTPRSEISNSFANINSLETHLSSKNGH